MRNTVENIIIVLITVIVSTGTGSFFGYQAAINSAERVIELQKPMIEEAIKKTTTTVHNDITNEFRKIKSKKSEPINIILDNKTKSVITDTNVFVRVEEKKGFLWGLFKKKNNK